MFVFLLLFGTFNGLKVNQLQAPTQTTLHTDSFYAVNSELDPNEVLLPNRVLALGLGEERIDPRIGRFVVEQVYENAKSERGPSSFELPLLPCDSSTSSKQVNPIEDSGSLYCLEKPQEYKLKGDFGGEEAYSLNIFFEICNGLDTCRADRFDYL